MYFLKWLAIVCMFVNISIFAAVEKEKTLKYEEEKAELEKLEKDPLKYLDFEEVVIFGSRIDFNSPALSDIITKDEIKQRGISQDLPVVIKSKPSVFVSNAGGGAGDSKIQIRGFDQSNVGVHINGVPVNDMENARVYWSNWTGLGGVVDSIQLQKGINESPYLQAMPGGIINIITDPALQEKKIVFNQFYGEGNFKHYQLSASSGLINDQFAINAYIERKTRDGVVNGTWEDAWGYYLGASYQINSNNKAELYVMGAPQRHGQRNTLVGISAYDSNYAKKFDDYSIEALAGFNQSELGINYNKDVAPVDPSYKGQQYFWGKVQDRYDSNFINIRENFYHKPVVNFILSSRINDKLSFSQVLHWSEGEGGGTGPRGAIPCFPKNGKNDFYCNGRTASYDLNAAIQFNSFRKNSAGILRNSVNSHEWYGAISKLKYELTDDLDVEAGIEFADYTGKHYREVRDLLGGEYFVFRYRNQYAYLNDAELRGVRLGLGDIYDYHNLGFVQNFNSFLKFNYVTDKWVSYLTLSKGETKYTYQDMLTKDKSKVKAKPIDASQIKGGVLYNVTDYFSVFTNMAFVKRPPTFDGALGYQGTVRDPKAESFDAYDSGIKVNWNGHQLVANYYYTNWDSKANFAYAFNESGEMDRVQLQGNKQVNKGIEIDYNTYLTENLYLYASIGLGDWKFTEDTYASYTNYFNGSPVTQEKLYTLKGIYVGGSPQEIINLGFVYEPINSLKLELLYTRADKYYAESTVNREYDPKFPADRKQNWKVPGFHTFDLYTKYSFELFKKEAELYVNVYNLTNQRYIATATDYMRYNGYNNNGIHDSDSVGVSFGPERAVNLGLSVGF